MILNKDSLHMFSVDNFTATCICKRFVLNVGFIPKWSVRGQVTRLVILVVATSKACFAMLSMFKFLLKVKVKHNKLSCGSTQSCSAEFFLQLQRRKNTVCDPLSVPLY